MDEAPLLLQQVPQNEGDVALAPDEILAAQAAAGFVGGRFFGTAQAPCPWTVVARMRGARFADIGGSLSPKCARDYSLVNAVIQEMSGSSDWQAWAWSVLTGKIKVGPEPSETTTPTRGDTPSR